MARQDDDPDDFWITSEIKCFSFDDDEDDGEGGRQLFGISKSGTARLSQQVWATLPGEDTGISVDSLSGPTGRTTLPEAPALCTLISERALRDKASLPEIHQTRQPNIKSSEELRMLRRQIEERWNEPPVDITIANMFLGRPHSLEAYRSFESKRKLLEAAINLGDGNSILEVVLFLVKTLKRSLLQQLLIAHPVAAAHYVKYLSTRLLTAELTDLLEMLGRSQDAAMKSFQMAISTQSPQRQLQKLQVCIRSHFIQGDDRLCQLVKNHVSLLEWQQAVGTIDNSDLSGKSVVECLSHACQMHWDDPRSSPTSPFCLAQKHGVSDRQLQWTILTVRADKNEWADIDSVFITKNWLGSGSKLKLALPIEEVVLQLHSKGAPEEVLLRYLGFIDSLERRMAVAKKINCHKSVIDGFKSLRDRQGLQGYKATLHPQSGAFLYAEDALRASTVKWKN